MDFVLALDPHEAVNTPEEYTVTFKVPIAYEWLNIGLQSLSSIEENWGIPPEELLDGGDKFLLRDGLTCVVTGDHGEIIAEVEVPVR